VYLTQTLYIALYGGYFIYWYLHQYAVPEWHPFTDPAVLPIVIMAFVVIGVG
jgi:hypothetical protein